MCDEPAFLEDETLLDSLDEEKAKRVLTWLLKVNDLAPDDLGHALYLAREINTFYKIREEDEKAEHLLRLEPDCTESFCISEVNDNNIFERIMTQLEEKYGKEI